MFAVLFAGNALLATAFLLSPDIARLLSGQELREDMSHLGIERAKHFSWQGSAESALEVLERVARAGKKR